MLIINLPETSKIAIILNGLIGNPSTYQQDVMRFFDIMEYKYAYIRGEIHLIDRINDKEVKKDLEKRFGIYMKEKGLPPWVGIKIE